MSGLLGGLHIVDFLLEQRKLTLSALLCLWTSFAKIAKHGTMSGKD